MYKTIYDGIDEFYFWQSNIERLVKSARGFKIKDTIVTMEDKKSEFRIYNLPNYAIIIYSMESEKGKKRIRIQTFELDDLIERSFSEAYDQHINLPVMQIPV